MLQLAPTTNKNTTISHVHTWIENQNLIITKTNSTKPWGAYYLIADSNKDIFISSFFPHLNLLSQTSVSLSLKFLLIAPHSRFSWQYHNYRQEHWSIIMGPVDIMLSQTDVQPPAKTYPSNSYIQIPQNTRHRLIGILNWGLVAEIWQHTNPNHLSNESDITRLQDDYQRQTIKN